MVAPLATDNPNFWSSCAVERIRGCALTDGETPGHLTIPASPAMASRRSDLGHRIDDSGFDLALTAAVKFLRSICCCRAGSLGGKRVQRDRQLPYPVQTSDRALLLADPRATKLHRNALAAVPLAPLPAPRRFSAARAKVAVDDETGVPYSWASWVSRVPAMQTTDFIASSIARPRLALCSSRPHSPVVTPMIASLLAMT